MQKIIGVTELQRRFRAFFEDVVKKRTPHVLTRGSRLEAALAGEASFVATGEDDLLTLLPFEGVEILRPAEFLTRLA
jgi:hypothetical protein